MFGQKKKLVMCQECRALIDPAEKVCPMCGNEAVPEVRVRVSSDNRIFFTFLILAINALLFILMGAAGVKSGGGMESFFKSAPLPVLVDFGSIFPPLVKQGQLWRLVTANFLHIGLLHLLFNSYALSQIGPIAEEIYGEQKFIFIYLLTGIFSCVGSYFFGIGGAGASGSLFGLMGLLAVYGFRQGGEYGKALMKSMLVWAGINILLGFAPGINNVAHIGGFLSGGAMGFLIRGEHPTFARSAKIWNALAVISVIVIISSFALVGKNYGAMQEQIGKEQETSRQAQNVINLHSAIRDANIALDDAFEVTAKSSLNDVAKNLRKNASAISGIAKIDEQSDEIRNRIIALIHKRADALEKAAKNPAASVVASADEVAAYEKAFKDYKAWQESVMDKYGLVYTKDE
jgi:rhomboid protease GluP